MGPRRSESISIRLMRGLAVGALFVALPGLAASGGPSAEPGCELAFTDPTFFGAELRPEDQPRIEKEYRRSMRTRKIPLAEDLGDFLETGWPELVRIAHEEGQSPSRLVRDALELAILADEARGVPSNTIEQHRQELEPRVSLVDWLAGEAPFKPNVALSPAQLLSIKSIQDTLRSVAYFAMLSEMKIYRASLVNPLLPLDGVQIRHAFRSLNEVGEEAVLAWMSENAPEPSAEVDADASEGRTTQAPSRSLAQPLPLKDFLSPEAKLIENQVYSFTNAHQEEFLIRLEREVVKEAAKGHDPVIKRLLHSLFTGDGMKAGLKRIPVFGGKDVVEIKAIMRGHKRLIGCLKGRHLVIKKFVDLPQSTSAYAKLIPASLCAD